MADCRLCLTSIMRNHPSMKQIVSRIAKLDPIFAASCEAKPPSRFNTVVSVLRIS